MTCHSPIQAYRSSQVNPKTGKRPMQFKPAGSYSGVRQMLPCGRCIGCKLDRSRTWAMRCMHESKMHAENCFITLTYNDEHLPEFGTLVKRDLQLFFKRLRWSLDEHGDGRKVRYYACGEYGDLNKRPHYHALLFGVNFRDRKLYSRNSRDEGLFTSKALDALWSDSDGHVIGQSMIGDLTFESAAYVARYCTKKITGDKADDHYTVYNADGVCARRLSEFSVMSLKPGIGTGYFDKFGAEIMQHDNVIVGGKAVPSVRFYDLKIERLAPSRLLVLKRNRRRKAVWFERTPDRRRVKEVLLLKQLKMKERKI